MASGSRAARAASARPARRALGLLLGLSACHSILAPPPPPDLAPLPPAIADPQISPIIADGRYNAFPWPARSPAGRLIVVYRDGATHVSVDGSVSMQTSDDGGLTWSEKRRILEPEPGHDLRDPSIVCSRTGRLLINYFDANGRRPVALLVAASDDQGATWTTGAPLTGYSGWTATSGAILATTTGRLLLPVYGLPIGATTTENGLLMSSDDGNTWGRLIPLGAAGSGHSETTLNELPDGSLRAFIRSDVATNLFSTVSSDGGQTWSSPTPLPFLVAPGRPAAARFPGTSGMILFYRGAQGRSAGWRASSDGGATWSGERIFSPEPFMYAGIVELGPGQLGVAVATEHGAGANIAFGRLRVP